MLQHKTKKLQLPLLKTTEILKIFRSFVSLGNISVLNVILFLSFFGSAQNSQINRTNHWYFGGGAGIDFTSGTAVADTNGQMAVFSGCATMSDTLGNLLMYTEGTTVWNKNHQIMPNGTGLLGDGTPVQSSIIIPKPLDDNLYYIITCAGYDGSTNGIRYSIVDISLNGGLGDVTLKNELLFQPSSEQLAATMHANCTDVWIMSHELNSNNYRAYLLTSSGIDTNNVVINDIGNFGIFGLHLKFSPNGKKMAADNYWDNINIPQNLDTLDLFDFDNATGLLSNLIKLPDTTIVAFNFSPNDNYLYVTNYNTNITAIPGVEEIFQYDLSSNNEIFIKGSKTLVYYPLNHDFNDFQIGIDNKMYVANETSNSISVINNPNNTGLSCDVQEAAISLNGRISYTSLPNFVSSYFNQDTTAGCYYTVGINEIHDEDFTFSVYPNPFNLSTNLIVNSSFERIEISLHNLFGQKLRTYTVHNSEKFEIHRNNLPSGIYLLNISINNKSYSQKLIITD